MPANTSYIDDSSNFSELWEMGEKKHIYNILSPEDDELLETNEPLNSDQSNRLIRALNWGREQIDNVLREKYVVSNLTHANANDTLKNWNVRYAVWMLEKRRYRSGESTTEDKRDIDDEVILAARENTPHSLNLTRQPSPLGISTDSHATSFDYGGQFNIPSRERDAVWPDGLNG